MGAAETCRTVIHRMRVDFLQLRSAFADVLLGFRHLLNKTLPVAVYSHNNSLGKMVVLRALLFKNEDSWRYLETILQKWDQVIFFFQSHDLKL